MKNELQVYCYTGSCDCNGIIATYRNSDKLDSAYKYDKNDDEEPHLYMFFKDVDAEEFETIVTDVKNRDGVKEIKYYMSL